MSGIKIANGTAASAEATVDTSGDLHVNLPTAIATAGYAGMLAVMDEGTVTGAREALELEPTADYRLRVGIDQVLFSECFPGSAINSSLWQTPNTTMTTAVANAWLTLNSGLGTATNTGCAVLSKRYFTAEGASGLSVRWRGQLSQAAQVGNVVEMGMFYPVNTTFVFNPAVAPLDGCFFRVAADQTFKCVANVAGVETVSASLDLATLVGTGVHDFAIDIMANDVHFWIDDVLVADLIDAAGAVPTATMALPIAFRVYNTGATGAAQTLKVGNVQVLLADVGGTLSAAESAASAGRNATQGATGGTIGQTALWVNASAPAATVPTNTTAAFGAGLGGNYLETATLAAGTDGIIASYQVPLGTAAIPGKSLMITGVRVTSAVHTAITGGGCVRNWALAYGHTAVSLLTAELATGTAPTKAPRRKPLGTQGVVATAAAGTSLTPVGGTFATPVLVAPGEFVQVVVKSVGTAITAGAIGHVIDVEGYWC